MTRDKSLEEIAYEALEEMYAEAEPPLDFEYARNNPDEMDDDWYQQHYLSEERQQEIVDDYIEEYNLDGGEQTSFHMTVILDLGPTTQAP